MDELVIGEKRYVSTKRAAEITGYAKDYVGQLCREGYVEAKMVGRSWYVLESAIREHRFGSTDGQESHAETSEHIVEHHTPQNGLQTPRNSLDHETIQTEEVLVDAFLDTWERPTYTPEISKSIPQLNEKSRRDSGSNEEINIVNTTSSEASAALTEMQVAWKEWFEIRHTREEANANEGISDDIPGSEKDHGDTGDSDTYEEEIEDTEDLTYEETSLHSDGDERATESAQGREEVAQEAEETPIQIHKVRIIEERIHRRDAPQTYRRGTDRSFWKGSHKPANAPPGFMPMSRTRSRKSNVLAAVALLSVGVIAIAVSLIGTGYVVPGFENNSVVDFLTGERTVDKTNK